MVTSHRLNRRWHTPQSSPPADGRSGQSTADGCTSYGAHPVDTTIIIIIIIFTSVNPYTVLLMFITFFNDLEWAYYMYHQDRVFCVALRLLTSLPPALNPEAPPRCVATVFISDPPG